MGYKAQPIRATINDAPKTMTNTDKLQLSKINESNYEKDRIERKQEEIDEYNFNTCNIIDDYFNTIQLNGNDIIVRLHRENYIKAVHVLPEDRVAYDAWTSQVDGRMHASDKAKWMDNPLPFVHSGVIVAISPTVKAEIIDKRNKLALINESLAKEYKVLEVGDIVHLTHFMFADFRFYKNKQEKDFIKNPEEYRLQYWEGYVKLHSSYIEAIVTDKNSFKVTSPYKQYKEYINK